MIESTSQTIWNPIPVFVDTSDVDLSRPILSYPSL